MIAAEKAGWFLEQIDEALGSKKLLIEEYELSNKDVKGLPDEGPDQPIWFEGRVQALDFLVMMRRLSYGSRAMFRSDTVLENKLRELSDTDRLTGLFNRRRLERELNSQYETFVRHSVPTSVLTLDLDDMKQINDTFGHQAGDEALITV